MDKILEMLTVELSISSAERTGLCIRWWSCRPS